MAKILVIEDSDSLRAEYLLWLSFEGHEVVEAVDGQAGVETALKSLPDLVLSDVKMPRLDGYGVLSALRSSDALSRTPFILMSAESPTKDNAKARHLDADSYLIKPFTRTQLLTTIETHLKRKSVM